MTSCARSNVVYPYIPTSNRNLSAVILNLAFVVYPYIPTSNRNLSAVILNLAFVVYPYIPTSNRNNEEDDNDIYMLYILIFLHQTATVGLFPCLAYSCISLYSYIKPQLARSRDDGSVVVYPYIPTSNRNRAVAVYLIDAVVYPYIPTSNRNPQLPREIRLEVVYPYIPTSNRNCQTLLEVFVMLYILIFLHQTATSALYVRQHRSCISLYSYIKPQLVVAAIVIGTGCISLYSYIKPQLVITIPIIIRVVYPYIPTSNRNLPTIPSFLQVVVYPYIPTSNRNRREWLFGFPSLYILIFLHQTATLISGNPFV